MENGSPRGRLQARVRAWSAMLMGLAAALTAQAVGPTLAAAVAVGDPVPTFAFQTVDGGRYDLLREARERLVLLSFVSPRCKPCEESRPALERLWRDHGTSGQLGLVSISLGAGPRGLLPKETPPFPGTELSATDATAAAWGVFGTPAFFLVDHGGIVRWKHVGRLLPGTLEPALNEVVAADGGAAAPGGS